jgi:hypothetical protein
MYIETFGLNLFLDTKNTPRYAVLVYDYLLACIVLVSLSNRR